MRSRHVAGGTNRFRSVKAFKDVEDGDFPKGAEGWASQETLVVKDLPAMQGPKRCRFDPWVGKVPCGGAWQPTPVFLPGKSHA